MSTVLQPFLMVRVGPHQFGERSRPPSDEAVWARPVRCSGAMPMKAWTDLDLARGIGASHVANLVDQLPDWLAIEGCPCGDFSVWKAI